MSSFYICAFITAVSAFTSLGFSIQAVRVVNNRQSDMLYTATRSAALAVVSIIPFFLHSKPFLSAIAMTMILVQALDAGIGIKLRDKAKTYGPASISLVNLAALGWLLS